MSVGLDSEGLLTVYADWIAFLREKQGVFAGQLTKLQAKGGGKEKTPPAPGVGVPAPLPPEPLQEVAPSAPPETAPDDAAPAWLFETAPTPNTEALAVPASVPEEEGDEWF